jgi:DnaJ like chaperone protein
VEGLEDCERLIDEDANTRADSEAEAYATLNLKPGATWPEVQAAYREACRRYHPDSLAGQGVPPHLVELAVQQFKAITAAYKLLKSRYAELNSN